MPATIIDGKAVAARVRAQVADGVADFQAQAGFAPGLATVLVGDDPASDVYVSGKQRASAEVGIRRRAGVDTPPLDPGAGGPLRVRELMTGVGRRSTVG